MNHKRKTLVRAVVALILTSLSIVAVIPVWRYVTSQQTPPVAPPAWRGIIPGQTLEPAAVNLIGPPAQVESRGEYVVYLYRWREDLGWKAVELWFQQRQHSLVLTAILLVYPYPSADALRLSEIVPQRERPDKVYWTFIAGYRYLLWPRQGVAARLEESTSSPWGLPVREVLLLEPTTIEVMVNTPWPWATHGPTVASGWTPIDPMQGTLPKDWLPLDPFDWQNAELERPFVKLMRWKRRQDLPTGSRLCSGSYRR